MDGNIIFASIGISCLYHWGSSIGTVISWAMDFRQTKSESSTVSAEAEAMTPH